MRSKGNSRNTKYLSTLKKLKKINDKPCKNSLERKNFLRDEFSSEEILFMTNGKLPSFRKI